MDTFQEIQFQLFILYFKHKLQKLEDRNINNTIISNFLKLINSVTEQNTPEKIKKLRRRFLK